MQDIIKILKEKKKPCVLFIEQQTIRKLKNPDCLSINGYIYRNGGNSNGEKALPFIEGTPELINLLKKIFQT